MPSNAAARIHPWKDSRPTALYRIGDSPAPDRDGDTPIVTSKKSTPKQESLEEHPAAWLLLSRGITKAVVVLINLTQNTRTPAMASVTVQARRRTSPGVLSVDEEHTPAVSRDPPSWFSQEDVPLDCPARITLYSDDIYIGPAQRKRFALPMQLLRNAVLATWELHLHPVEANAALIQCR